MKKLFAAMLIILFVCCSCSESAVKKPSYENEAYTGFSDIQGSYSAENALEDGCFVIRDGVLIGGRDKWEGFLKDSQNGRDSFLRVVHFIEDEPYFTDLYYSDGSYQTFEKNHEIGITSGEKFTLLRRLEGKAGAAEKDSYFYVLTDSEALTYYDVSMSLAASSFELVTDIPFEWLGFTVYLG